MGFKKKKKGSCCLASFDVDYLYFQLYKAFYWLNKFWRNSDALAYYFFVFPRPYKIFLHWLLFSPLEILPWCDPPLPEGYKTYASLLSWWYGSGHDILCISQLAVRAEPPVMLSSGLQEWCLTQGSRLLVLMALCCYPYPSLWQA